MRPAATICVGVLLILGAVEVGAQLTIDTTTITITRGPCGLSRIPPLQASGGSGNYEWVVLSGQLPPDLELQPNGDWGGKMDWSWVNRTNTTTADIQVTDLANGSTAQNAVLFDGQIVSYAGDSSA